MLPPHVQNLLTQIPFSSTEQYVRYPSSITGAPVAALCLTLGALAQ
ncbi:hypothetical protein EFM7_1304 [Enterococcus faecalis M7]|nr:hypothetical protein EFM7_1304 [Enterococcus faecalis M7]